MVHYNNVSMVQILHFCVLFIIYLIKSALLCFKNQSIYENTLSSRKILTEKL